MIGSRPIALPFSRRSRAAEAGRREQAPPACAPARARAVLVLCTLLGLGGGATFAQDAAADIPLRKVAEYRMVQARQGAAVTAVGDYVYIFGGSGGGDPIYQAERLNIRTGTVEALPPRFKARRYHNVIEHEGRFLLFGGQGYALPGQVLEEVIEVYDPATQTLTEVGKMPRPRQHAGAIRIGREVYFIGGGRHNLSGGYGQTNDVQVYALDTGTWRPGPAMPTLRESPAVQVGQFVIVAGGYARRNNCPEVELFVPAEQAWKKLPPLAQPISAHSAAHLGRWLFLFGDFDQSDRVLAYELTTRRTFRLSPGLADVRFSTATTHEDRIYVVGGQAFDAGQAGGGRNLNAAQSRGFERDLIQVFALSPAPGG